VNQAIETMVYANPEQYGWVHKRFKTQPPGAPPVY
jgi:KDO2-lipid IV(A) lauroyltransferase